MITVAAHERSARADPPNAGRSSATARRDLEGCSKSAHLERVAGGC
ncbi:MAG: hypothetical protein M3360_11135 [Actinomycetota bacterium]|nr:hypothetical protein [Actinomycetota bacterium]